MNLQLFQLNTKQDLKQYALDLVNNAIENSQALQIAEEISMIEAMCKAAKEHPKLKDEVRNEIVLNAENKKDFKSKFGATISLAETGVVYDFSQCNDLVLNDLQQRLSNIKEQIKERESFLKNISPKGIEIIDKNTGELVTIYPPSKTSTSSYKISLSK